MKNSSPQPKTEEVLETMRGIAAARNLTIEALRDELNQILYPSKLSVSAVQKWKNQSPKGLRGESMMAIMEWNRRNAKFAK